VRGEGGEDASGYAQNMGIMRRNENEGNALEEK
jgi:hypothetical protein